MALDGGKGVVVNYTSPQGSDGNIRKGVVIVNCNPNAIEPMNIQIYNPPNYTSYSVQFDSAYACPVNMDKKFYLRLK